MQSNTRETLNARDKVLATALSLFVKKGYFNTSMRDITGESSVSTGSVYHYFKDKEGVAAALYKSVIERMRESLQQIINSNDTAHDQCRAVISLIFKIAEEEPEIMSFMLYTKHHEFLKDERPVCSSEPFEIMRSMVQFGMDNGEIEKRDVLVASTCLFGGAIRMITSYLDGILDNPLSEYLDDIWNCSWRAIASDNS